MYRFIAGAMEAAAARDAAFEKATVGYYLCEGGQEPEGARALLEAGHAAAKNGFLRAAVRLAAAAVQYDPSPETRAKATELSRSVTSRSVGGEEKTARVTMSLPAPEPGSTLKDSAVSALLARDFDAVDRLLDIAVAEGHDQMAVDRFRAVALLTRGDLGDAIEALARVRRQDDAPDGAVARDEVARGLLSMARGRSVEGVRAALRALSMSRASGDLQGEAAALSTLALCYRALGRHDEAVRFDDASPA
jgi:tetratricopeptide (TPR) repeat protein